MDRSEVKRVFEMLHGNGDGRITVGELSESLQNLGILIPEKDLRQMLDADADGCVDAREFGALCESMMEERVDEEEDDMREAFNVFDQNRDGFITVEELRTVLSSLGLKQATAIEDCKNMIMRVDVDGDGRVNYKEFRQMMKGGFSSLALT